MPDPNICSIGKYKRMDFEGNILHIICRLRNIEVLEEILNLKTIDINKVCESSKLNPLMLACLLGYDDIVEILLKYGSNPCALNDDKYNVLYYAVKGKNYNCIKLIVENGAVYI